MSTNHLKYGVGVDMSMNDFHACISIIDYQQTVSIRATRKFTNNKAGFDAFLQWVKKHAKLAIPIVYLVEATGVYHELLAWYLFKHKEPVCIILPNKAKRYKESLGLNSKNDAIDAKGLSRMACEQHLRPWEPISEQLYAMRLITRQIANKASQATQLKNQLHALQHGMYRDKNIEKMLLKDIELFEKQKHELEDRIESIVQGDPILKESFDKICQIKGIAIGSVAVIVSETNGFALMENQAQLVSFAGYDVIENQSGKRSGKTRISKKGNSHIRKALHFPALNVVKYKQAPFADLYDRVYNASGIKMKGYTAVQKKLLIVIFALWKKQVQYDPEYRKAIETTKVQDAA